MVLSEVTHKRSPWIWIQYGNTGERKKWHKTNVRKDAPPEVRVKKIALEKNLLESMLLKADGNLAQDGKGWAWVANWLAMRYKGKQRTAEVYLAQWKRVLEFLIEKEIAGPQVLEREHAFQYIQWRTDQVKPKSGKSIKLSTAMGEITLLKMVMGEAKVRFHLPENPILKLGVEEDDAEMKPELTDDEIQMIYEGLKKKPVWMFRAFHIALHTGLRHKDTRLHRSQVRREDDWILIEKPKGGRKREFGIPIYPSISEMLNEWLDDSRDPYLWTIPEKDVVMSGLIWHKFFHHELKMPHLAFKCTRITFIMDGLRKKIPENVMLKMVNHGTTTINRIYQRWTPDAVREYSALLSSRVPGAAK